MRNTAFALVFAFACGGGGSNNGKKDAADQPPDDAAPEHDAPPLMTCNPVSGTNVQVRMIGQVSGSAVLVTAPKNDGRLFVIEQQGRIRIFENEVLNPTPYLDVSSLVSGGTPPNEQGLLGLAFHPNFAANRQFYVFYTTSNANVVARYTQSATDPNKADTTGEVILSIPDSRTNHNGGMIEFGPKDGYLYIGTGDGGGGGDPDRTSQNKDSLLGKILRIDVNTTTGNKKYGIPSDNPYATAGGAPEVFVLGLRNPWRWSFDRETGDMYIGDVGQGGIPTQGKAPIEEVTVLKHGEIVGKNLGWSVYEGNECFNNGANYPCNTANLVAPQYTNGGGAWRSVIGGEVYRGECYPDLKGYYFFTDYSARPLMRGKLEANGSLSVMTLTTPTNWPQSPISLHGDARGELYVTNTQGRVFHIEAGP
jgi:glucose/arabinose dehydrogenase